MILPNVEMWDCRRNLFRLLLLPKAGGVASTKYFWKIKWTNAQLGNKKSGVHAILHHMNIHLTHSKAKTTLTCGYHSSFSYINPTSYHVWRKVPRYRCTAHTTDDCNILYLYTLHSYSVFARTNNNKFSFRHQLTIAATSLPLSLLHACYLFPESSCYFFVSVNDCVWVEQIENYANAFWPAIRP